MIVNGFGGGKGPASDDACWTDIATNTFTQSVDANSSFPSSLTNGPQITLDPNIFKNFTRLRVIFTTLTASGTVYNSSSTYTASADIYFYIASYTSASSGYTGYALGYASYDVAKSTSSSSPVNLSSCLSYCHRYDTAISVDINNRTNNVERIGGYGNAMSYSTLWYGTACYFSSFYTKPDYAIRTVAASSITVTAKLQGY